MRNAGEHDAAQEKLRPLLRLALRGILPGRESLELAFDEGALGQEGIETGGCGGLVDWVHVIVIIAASWPSVGGILLRPSDSA